MITENVYSPIFDSNIKKDVVNSPIWGNCYKEEEVTNVLKSAGLWRYTIKFNNTTPVQVTNIKNI
jgi:hypothetical protein